MEKASSCWLGSNLVWPLTSVLTFWSVKTKLWREKKKNNNPQQKNQTKHNATPKQITQPKRQGLQDWVPATPTGNPSPALPADRDRVQTPVSACLFTHQHFFNISPSPSAFTIYSNFPNSAFALSWKGHVAPFSPGTRSPAHRWSCRDFGCDFGSSSALWKHIDTSNAPGPV